jgi:hypothetical protein
MSRGQHRVPRRGPDRARWNRLTRLVAIPLVLVLTSNVAWAYWTAGSGPGGYGAAAATTVNQGATPAASSAGNVVTVSWAASTLASGSAVAGYIVKRYVAVTPFDQGTILSACTGRVAVTTCTETSVPTGQWVYTVAPVLGTNWTGTESPKSNAVTTDPTPPVNAISMTVGTGNAFKSGATIYYRGAAAGSFTLTNAVTDAGSGPASSATVALTGTSTGWTHSPSTVSTPSGGPYVSTVFSWAAATSSAPTEVVTGRDVAGWATTTTLSFVDDSTPPGAGSIAYTDGYQPARSVAVTFTTGTDAGSGIVTRQLQRSSAVLSGGLCAGFGAFTNLGPDTPTSVYTDGQVANGVCYQYRYVVTDQLGNQDIAASANVAKVDYAGAVAVTTGLLSQWRLGESATSLSVSDSFAGTAGTNLQSHAGEIGATWTRHILSASDAQFTAAGRIFKAGATTNSAVYYASAVPASADYTVEADVFVASVVASDAAGIMGRLDPAAGIATATYYLARYEISTQRWVLYRSISGAIVNIGWSPVQVLAAGSTYRVSLSMTGSTIRVLVDGVAQVSVTNTDVTVAGRAGFALGFGGSNTTVTNTTGLHLDNFQVNPATYPRAVDSKGSNTADYVHGVIMGAAGALAGDANTAATFDGANDLVQAVGTTGIPVGAAARSVEMWFKTSGVAAGQVRQALFSYGTNASGQEFGAWLESSGTTIRAWDNNANNDFTFANLNDNQWHHFVETYDGASMNMYVDGLSPGAQAATRNTVMDASGFGIGSVPNQNIGAIATQSFFNGSLDEVSLYNVALPAATVAKHFALGDSTGPAGGSLVASGLVGTGSHYSTSTTLSLTLAKGADGSGVAASGAQLLRATATLTSAGGTADGVCGSFGVYALVTGGADPVSPKTDAVADQACYSYRYVVADTLGNPTIYTSASIKVDTTASAAPPLAFSAFTNTSWGGAGSTVYYRSLAASGSFTTTASGTDAASGVATYVFPALGANWTSTPGALGVTTYSWSGAPAAPGPKNVTATNNAGSTSATSPFTLTADDTAPTAATVTYLDGTTTSTSVTVTLAAGTDGASGIGTRVLQRATATLTGITCGAFGAYATVTNGTNPTSPLVDTVVAGTCYKYQYVVSDNVGNSTTTASASLAKISLTYLNLINGTAGLFSYWRLGEASPASPLADSKGTNPGVYNNSPTLGRTGAIGGDPNTAAGFSGANQYGEVNRGIQDDFSIEAWFKSAQVFSNDYGQTHCQNWWQGAGLVDAASSGSNDFGLALCDGMVVGGVGGPDTSIRSSAGYNDDAWHHVVFTRTKLTGVMQLYVDGVAGTPVVASTQSLISSGKIDFGRSTAGVDYFVGSLDEIAVYTSVLDQTTVTAHYNARR